MTGAMAMADREKGPALVLLMADGWRGAAARLAFAALLLLSLFWRDAADMARIWWQDSTYGHCLLIPPVIGWLVWQRRQELAQLTPRGWVPGLLWMAGAGFGWLLGDAAGVAIVRQLALVLMVQGAVLTLLGPQVARGLLFPLFFAFFMVPAGDELVPYLQTLTAEMTMPLLALTGIPAHLEGIFITTPTGYFKVAEACAGVNFLIAMLAYGALVANLCFRRWSRRIAFMALAVLVPVLANGVRAWGTIFIAHHAGIEFAAGFDHIFYGWIFFALVWAIVMALAWPFFDRRVDDPAIDVARLMGSGWGGLQPVAALLWAAALIAAPLFWSSLSAGHGAPVAKDMAVPMVKNWRPDPAPFLAPWQPHYAGAAAERMVRYRHAEGAVVDLYVALYADQGEGRELVGFGQGAVAPESAWVWRADTRRYGPVGADGQGIRIRAPGPVEREVATFHVMAGRVLTGALAVKLATVKARLLHGDRRAAAILLSSEVVPGRDPARDIERFLADLGPVDDVAARMMNGGD